MRLLAGFLIISVSFAPMINAYPKEQFNDFILIARSTPAVLGIPKESIEQFCDCALKEIFENGQNDQISVKTGARNTPN